MIRLLFIFAFLASFASAQTIGQYELRKRGASGFTSYGITLSNGQVIGLTADVPAAITPLIASSNLSDLASATTARSNLGLVIGTNVQAYNANLTTYAGITPSANVQTLLGAANYAAFRSSLGLGAAALLATSTGGNGIADDGKVVIFTTTGAVKAAQLQAINSGDAQQIGYIDYNGLTFADHGNSGFDHIIIGATLTASRTHTLPDASGTFINTGNLSSITTVGTVTSGTWNGTAIGLGYIAQGGATSGQVLSWNGSAWAPAAGGGGITIGTTTITSGTSGRVLYNNAGVVGEMTTSGSGTVIALATSPTFTTPALGTPSAIVLTNATGSPTGISLTKSQLNTVVSDDDPAYIGAANVFTAAQRVSLGITQNTPNLKITSTNTPTGLDTKYSYLHLGGTEFAAPGYYLITFGYVSATAPAAFFGYKMTSTSGNTKGDLIFGTRDVTTDTSPTARLTIAADGTATFTGSVTTGGLTIGASGSAIASSLTTTTTWDPSNLADGASETKATITLTGVAVGDVVKAALTTITSASWDVQATVVSANTVDVRITNRTGGAVDLASGTLRITCIKF